MLSEIDELGDCNDVHEAKLMNGKSSNVELQIPRALETVLKAQTFGRYLITSFYYKEMITKA